MDQHLDINVGTAESSDDCTRLLGSGPADGNTRQHAPTLEQDHEKNQIDSENRKDYHMALPTFVRGYVGSGLLALPFVFYQAGIVWGIILTITCCLSNHYLMKLVALTCDDCGVSRDAWGNMCKAVGGRRLKIIGEVSLLVSQLGTCIGETMFALKFLNYAFCALSIDSMCDQGYKHVILYLAVIIPLTAVTNMRHLSWPNEIADFATVAFITVTVLLGISQLGSLGSFFTNLEGNFFTVNLGQTALFCGTLLYAIGGVGAILDVRNSMNNKQVFYRVLRNGFLVIGLHFGFFGAFNSLVSLDKTQEIYLYNLPVSTISLSSQIVYLFTITMTYITNQFPIITILENWADPDDHYFHDDRTEGGMKMQAIRYSMRYGLLVVVIAIACLLPSFNLLLSLVGSYNFMVMNGLIPVLTYNSHFKGRISTRTMIINVGLLLFCVIFGGFGMIQSVYKMFAPETLAAASASS